MLVCHLNQEQTLAYHVVPLEMLIHKLLRFMTGKENDGLRCDLGYMIDGSEGATTMSPLRFRTTLNRRPFTILVRYSGTTHYTDGSLACN